MDKYIKLDLLAKGCKSNTIYLVKNLEDNKRIIIDMANENQAKQNKNEIEIFQSLNHPNIIKYLESFFHKDKLCIIMDYAEGGDLSSVIKKHFADKKTIEEDQIWIWFIQVCQAIKYIHSKKILHRDIKSQNIFLTKTGQAKLGDFGISKVLTDTMDFAKTSLGTPYFLSPEICCGNKYNFKTDIWMLGCVLYELCCLKKPFEGENFHRLIYNIMNTDILPIPKQYSENLKIMINSLLKKDPSKRPTINEILTIDWVIEKMCKLNLIISPQEKNKKIISPLNRNVGYSPSVCSTYSPVNENDKNFYLFNLRFDNLLKGMQDESEDNSGSNSKSNSENEENKLILGKKEFSRFQLNKIEFERNIQPRHKKYSPSYAQGDYNRMIINMNQKEIESFRIPNSNNSNTSNANFINKSRFISNDQAYENTDANTYHHHHNSNKLQTKFKNHFSHPELHSKGKNHSAYESSESTENINSNIVSRPRHGRNYSMNCNSNFHSRLRINSNFSIVSQANNNEIYIKKPMFSSYAPRIPPKGNVTHSIISKHLNKNEINEINFNTGSHQVDSVGSHSNKSVNNFSTNPSTLKWDININIDTDKYKKYKENLYKTNSKAQTKFVDLKPENTNEDYILNRENYSKINGHPNFTNIKNETLETKQTKSNISETTIYLNQLVSKFGESVVNELIKLIENSTNPIKILNESKEFEKIVGKDYKIAQFYLFKIFLPEYFPCKDQLKN